MSKLGLEFVKKLRPCTFQYKPGEGAYNVYETHKPGITTHCGFIAQDIQEIAPKDSAFITNVGQGEDKLFVNYYEFIAPIVKAIQEQNQIMHEMIMRLEKEIIELKDKINA